MDNAIVAGTAVEFDSRHGHFVGTVLDIDQDHATVEVDHDLPGILHFVAIEFLKRTGRP